MGIFDKTVDQYTFDDVATLTGVSESVLLEFKAELDSKDPWEDLLKEIVAFANTYGGYLILGAVDKGSKLAALVGIDRIDGFQQKIIDLCLTGILPAITPYPSPPIQIPDSSKVLYVIHVPATLMGPHFLINRKGAYVRVSEHNKPYRPRPAEWDDLVHLADRRDTTIKQRTFLAERASKRSRQSIPGDAVFAEIFIGPAYPSGPLVDVVRLNESANASGVQARGMSYPWGDPHALFESVAYTPDLDQPQEYYMEVTQFGTVFAAIDCRRLADGKEIVPFVPVLANMLMLLTFGTRFLRTLGYQGPVFISIAMHQIQRKVFLWTRPGGFFDPFASSPRFDNDAVHQFETSTHQLINDRNSVALLLFRPLIQACGLKPMLALPDDVVIESAIQYLGWTG